LEEAAAKEHRERSERLIGLLTAALKPLAADPVMVGAVVRVSHTLGAADHEYGSAGVADLVFTSSGVERVEDEDDEVPF